MSASDRAQAAAYTTELREVGATSVPEQPLPRGGVLNPGSWGNEEAVKAAVETLRGRRDALVSRAKGAGPDEEADKREKDEKDE